ncbi:LPS export ABC transporter permease LptG [Pararhizobium sp.]|uniref:LPS export ABC transporter permease LptG n=1 Tax=Pararhizobium sp. TaxID=1977563 RepID=UPI002725B880|nr:LPS export ABC transporter permease LptG [Pararhizobium sp.]MDO9417575.1 LPS export ABC transporter permease LptG [Pararhizobium sp.]
MIFGILGRYFFRRYAIIALWFLIGVAALVFFIDFSEVSGRMSNLPHYTLLNGLLMTAVRLPTILQQTLPFIALFVGMTALLTLNRRYELVVTRAAGISVWQFMAPLIVGSLLLGIGGTAVLNPLAAWGTRTALDLESVLRATASASGPSIPPWLRQTSGDEDTILGARTIGESGTELFGVTVIHIEKDGTIGTRQDAASAKLEDGYWLLKDVKETKPGERQRTLPTVELRTNLKQEYMTERLAQPEAIGFFELPRKIQLAKSLGISPKALQTQFHSLVSLPFLLLAMTLIAATVCLKFSRFNQSRSVILGGILSGFVLYVVTVLIKAFGSSGVVPPFVAAWLPVVVAMALGSTILLHQEDG